MGELFAILVLVLVAYAAIKVLYVVVRVLFLIVRDVVRAVAFVLSLPFRAVGLVGSAVTGGGDSRLSTSSAGHVLGVRCGNASCRCAVVAGTRFCRRCGQPIRA